MLIRHVMTENLEAVSPETTLGEAYDRMHAHKFDCLPVLNQDRNLVGILQITDVYEACMDLGRQGALPKAVSGFMVSPVLTIDIDDPVEKAANLMRRRDIPALPVLDEGKLVGMVTTYEIFKATAVMLGAATGTTRITLVVPEAKGQLARIGEIIRNSGHSVANLATFHSDFMEQYKIVLRINADVIEPLLESLQSHGFKVLHTCID